MHLNNNQIINTMKANLLIFSHTFSISMEHFCGTKRMSPREHCKLRQSSSELRSTEKDIISPMQYLSSYQNSEWSSPSLRAGRQSEL